MTEPNAGREPAHIEDEEISLVALASFLLRWRRTIIALGLVGAAVGLAIGLTRTRVYVSSSTFIPQGSEAGSSGLALAASQFGIRLPASAAVWGPPIYLELLSSRSVLERIALDTAMVTDGGGRRSTLMNLLKVDATTSELRNDQAVRALRDLITATEVKPIGGVTVTVTTPWPHVSLALAERLVREVNRFNIEIRKSQAAAERQFTEIQADEAERALREAEDKLQSFLQRNRSINSPELSFDRDRLQRAMATRQQVYTSLVQMRDEAKIREVRDTPVITVLEPPRLPLVGKARKSIKKGVLGGLVGGMIGVLIAFLTQLVSGARRAPNKDAREFFQLVEEATPRFLRRKRR